MPLSAGARDRGRDRAQRLGASELARQAFLAELHPTCPQDGLAGAYIGVTGLGVPGATGDANPIHLAFACSHRDTFAYNSQTGTVTLIPFEAERSIRLEPLDRLTRWQEHHVSASTSAWTRDGPSPR